jgi:hypothetical protein
MSLTKTSRRTALGLFALFGVSAAAGWLSHNDERLTPQLSSSNGRAVDVLGAKTLSQPRSSNDDSEVLADLERRLALCLDPHSMSYSGERLAQLCLQDHARDLPGPNEAFSYAARWAQCAPERMFEWFLQRGRFSLPTNDGESSYGFTPTLFGAWAIKDFERAVDGARKLATPTDKRDALVSIISTAKRNDPKRAAKLLADNAEVLAVAQSSAALSAYGPDFAANFNFLREMPITVHRSKLLGQFFNDVVRYHPVEARELWRAAPDVLRRELVAGGFVSGNRGGLNPLTGEIERQVPAAFDGLADLVRQHAETSGDSAEAGGFLRLHGAEWADRDIAGAVAWSQSHLRGRQRVTETARLFSDAAARDFNTAMNAWVTLPPSTLRALAAGHLAAAAPPERKSEIEAIIGSLPPGDAAKARQIMTGSTGRARRRP